TTTTVPRPGSTAAAAPGTSASSFSSTGTTNTPKITPATTSDSWTNSLGVKEAHSATLSAGTVTVSSTTPLLTSLAVASTANLPLLENGQIVTDSSGNKLVYQYSSAGSAVLTANATDSISGQSLQAQMKSGRLDAMYYPSEGWVRNYTANPSAWQF